MHIIAALVLIVLLASTGAAYLLSLRKVVPSDVARHRTNAQRAIDLHPVSRAKAEEDRRWEALRFQQQMQWEKQQADLALKRDEFMLKAWQTQTLISPETYILNHEPTQLTALPSLKRIAPNKDEDRREEIDGPAELPTNISYAEIRMQIPRGHVLVGIGRAGVETKDRAVGACVWIVGLSGTGKTSTTVLRVEERAAAGHRFMGVDPHWFKPDSLTNAVAAYRSLFTMPIARTSEEANAVYRAFLDEFQGRKAGRIPQPWQPLTLLSDEVGAQMDTLDAVEEENAQLLKSIARICGQEARNFEMGGIFISQQATGLAWLRKVALMVIVHQLLMESEKKLATNNDTAVMQEMKSWPIGRTYVFGVGFQDGPRTVQQPRFDPPGVVESTVETPSARLPHDFQSQQWEASDKSLEANGEAAGSDESENNGISDLSTIKILREIGKRLRAGEDKQKIKADMAKRFGLPYGRATQEVGAVVDMIAEQIEAEA